MGLQKKRHKVEEGQAGKRKRINGCRRGKKRVMGVCKHSILYTCIKLMRPIVIYSYYMQIEIKYFLNKSGRQDVFMSESSLYMRLVTSAPSLGPRKLASEINMHIPSANTLKIN